MLLPGILELLPAQEGERPGDPRARVRRKDHFIDEAPLGDGEGVGETGFILLGMGFDPTLVVEFAAEQNFDGDRVVLMGSAGIQAPPSEQLKSIMNYDFTTDGMRKIVKGLTNPAFEANEALVNYRHALSIEDDTRAAYSAVMGWIHGNGGLYYEEDYIRRVSQPTLVVNGKLDLVVPITSAYRLLELIDDSWGFIIPDCGHWAMMERPKEFTAVTMSFLGS